jgi:hypothetical protein
MVNPSCLLQRFPSSASPLAGVVPAFRRSESHQDAHLPCRAKPTPFMTTLLQLSMLAQIAEAKNVPADDDQLSRSVNSQA